MVALDPHTLGESFGDVRTIAQLTRSREAALDLVARQRARVDAVRSRCAGPSGSRGGHRVVRPGLRRRPLDAADHRPAGGIDVLGFAGEHSEQSTWETVAAAGPRVVVAMPCGYDAERSHAEATALRRRAADGRRRAGRRRRRLGLLLAPGAAAGRRPRAMAHILHPDLVPEPAGAVLEVEV